MKELGLFKKCEWPQDQATVGSLLLVRSSNFPLTITEEMCRQEGLITTGYAWRQCKKFKHIPKVLIDRYTLKRDGTYQIWIHGKEVSAISMKEGLGNRPWN
jgi:hypothetical protein